MQKTILVVDDDPIFSDLVGDILAPSRFSILYAANGLEAMSMLREKKIDFIVSDIDMPKMNGLEFYDLLQSDEDIKRISFVFLTGSGDDAMIEDLSTKKHVRVIRKCEALEGLLDLISELSKE